MKSATYFQPENAPRKAASRTLILAFLAIAMACLPVRASAREANDTLPYGPKIGAAVGAKLVGLRDHDGVAQTFGMLTGKRGLILIFSRSLSW